LEAAMIDLLGPLVIAGLAGSFGSRLKHDPVAHPPKGALLYRGYDRGGVLIIKGWLFIRLHDSADVDGEWCLDRVGDPENTGPQIGLGALRGRIEGTKLSLNLNPGFADFNVSLNGMYDGAVFTGVWRYKTIRGIVSEGAFEAARHEDLTGTSL
jgi:hypothetical protein